MATIIIDNSISRIIGLTSAETSRLKDILSYTVGSYAAFYSGGVGPRKRSLLTKRGEFPTGLLHRIRPLFPDASIKDLRIVPDVKDAGSVFEAPKLYIDQRKAVDAAIVNSRGIITMPTGTGKSLVIAALIHEFQVDTLIIVPSVEIKKQLIETINRTITATTCRIIVENIDNPRLKISHNFDMLIIDECHHVAAKTYRKLNRIAWNKIYYRFHLTATPFRNDTEETLLFESIAGQVIYRLDYETAVRRKYIVPVEGFYIDIPRTDNDCYSWREVYSQLIINNESRNEIIAMLLLRLQDGNASTICLVKEISHGKILSDMTGIPLISGEDDESRNLIRQFNTGGIVAVIATEGIMGEGVDSRPAEYIVIAGLGKAKSRFMQAIGRGVRKYKDKESCKVILFRDASHKYCLRHFKEQSKILKEEYEIKVTKLEVP